MRLDVGCGSKPRGDVNVDFFSGGWNPQEGDQQKGKYLNPKSIKNFRVADAQNLPYKDGEFEVVFSSNTIEHVQDPFQMLSEMVRVSSRMAIILCPHAKGSGAKRPYHVNYLDEEWFRQAAKKLGVQCEVFISAYDYPLTNKLSFIPNSAKKSLVWRATRHFERRIINKGLYCRPFELEVRLTKPVKTDVVNDLIQYVVAVDNPKIFYSCFKRSAGVTKDNVITYKLVKNLSECYNRHIKERPNFEGWFVFAHQDFILKKPLDLKQLRTDAVYGVIGARLTPRLIGQIQQTDGSYIGARIVRPEPVHTIDEMCIIVHSNVFKKGLRFDPDFPFHFHASDLCLAALKHGFGVYALQTECQHKSRTLKGSVDSNGYLQAKKLFRIKWLQDLPVRTTTGLID